jgi:hypothetical protein
VEGGLTAPGTRSNRPGSSGEIWFFEEIFCEHACLDQRILWLKSQVVLSWFALVSIDLVFPGRRGLTAPSMWSDRPCWAEKICEVSTVIDCGSFGLRCGFLLG